MAPWQVAGVAFCFLVSLPQLSMALLPQSRLSRRTLPSQEPEAVFPARQFWFDTATRKLWWDLELFWQYFRTRCDRKQQRSRWIDTVEERAAWDLPNGQRPDLIRSKAEAPVEAPRLANKLVVFIYTMFVYLNLP